MRGFLFTLFALNLIGIAAADGLLEDKRSSCLIVSMEGRELQLKHDEHTCSVVLTLSVVTHVDSG